MEREPSSSGEQRAGVPLSARLDAHFKDIKQQFPADRSGVPQIPYMSPDQTLQYLRNCARVDAALNDAGARATAVEERNIAKGSAAAIAEDWTKLVDLPSELAQLAVLPPKPPPEMAQKEHRHYENAIKKLGIRASSEIVSAEKAVDEHCGTFERSMAGPTDVDRRLDGMRARREFIGIADDDTPEPSASPARDGRITFGMSQLMSDAEQKDFCALDDRRTAVGRVNRFLDYGNSDRLADRTAFSEQHAATLANVPAFIDSYYASTDFGTKSDGFKQMAQVRHDLSFVAEPLDRIQQRDGIGNDGTFTLPMLDERQSAAWLSRCERMDAVLSAAELHPSGKASAAQVLDQARSGMSDLLAMPKALATVQRSDLAPNEKSAEVERLIARSEQLDDVQQAVVDQSAPKIATPGLAAAARLDAPFQSGPQWVPAAKSRSFANRLSDAWDRVRTAVQGLNPFRSSTPVPAPAPATSLAGGSPLDAASRVAIHMLGPDRQNASLDRGNEIASPGADNEVASLGPDNKIPSRYVPTTILPYESSESHDEPLIVRDANGGKITASGTFEGLKHVGNEVEIDYTIRDHHLGLKIDEQDPVGRALGHAAEELKPGDNFKLSIGRDREGKEIAQIDDRTSGQSVTVDRSGRAEEHALTRDVSHTQQLGR